MVYTLAALTKEVMELLQKEHLVYAATATKGGVPNVSPKGSIAVVDDKRLVFAEIASPHTIQNLLENPLISLYVLDKQAGKGAQIKGEAELVKEGPRFDAVADALKKMRPELPPAHYAVYIKVQDVFPYGM
jgi:predicted pyridoxine 5'-phosphate oxidase superfamily flavin-nucleotide-binding protein